MAKGQSKVFAVFGLGTFGRTLVRVLTEKGAQVVVVDNNPATIEEFKNKVTAALLIDVTDERAVAKAPLDDVDTAIVCIGDNLEVNIITTALLKQRGIPYIISRAVSSIHAQVLRQIGANEVVNLQEEEGKRIGQRLIAPQVLDTIPISKSFSIAEVYVPQGFIGKAVSEMALEAKFNLKLMIIRRTLVDVDSEGNPVRVERVIFPESAEVLQNADVLIVAGNNADIDSLRSTL